MNKYLFSHLSKQGMELIIVDVPQPKILRFIALFYTFCLPVKLWKKRFDGYLAKLHKTAWAFNWRSKFCERKLKEYKGKYDQILQIAGMFAPFSGNRLRNDYAIMLSYNMELSRKYPQWASWPREIEKWVRLEKKLYQNAKTIFTTNENVRKSLIKDYGVPENKVITVGYGLTFDNLPEFEKTYDGKTILFIGMDFERKGGFILLEAFKKVKQAIPDACLVIIGPDKDTLKINQPGVEILGCIRDRKIIEENYKKASVFVMPSLCEPFGLVFLEAMAYKLPCIGTNVDAMPEIIEDGKTGFLVPLNDINSLANKLINLLRDPALMNRIGTDAYSTLKLKFSWFNVANRIDIALKDKIT